MLFCVDFIYDLIATHFLVRSNHKLVRLVTVSEIIVSHVYMYHVIQISNLCTKCAKRVKISICRMD